jgi:hypothetical protein
MVSADNSQVTTTVVMEMESVDDMLVNLNNVMQLSV